MKLFLLLIFSLFCQYTIAATEVTKILMIDEPVNSEEPYLLLAESGEAFELDQDNLDDIEKAVESTEKNLIVELVLNQNSETNDLLEIRNSVKQINILPNQNPVDTVSNIKALKRNTIAPIMNSYITNFTSAKRVSSLFNNVMTVKNMRKKSQCYNRAHVWSWQLNKYYENGRKIQPGKIWIYFTRKYKRVYGHKWWFHVAPYVKLNDKEYVLDKRFFDKPVTPGKWANKFMKKLKRDANCTTVDRYSQYKANQDYRYCIFMKSSVFYWQPQHLRKAESNGTEKEYWIKREVRRAYQDAIGRRATPPRIDEL